MALNFRVGYSLNLLTYLLTYLIVVTFQLGLQPSFLSNPRCGSYFLSINDSSRIFLMANLFTLKGFQIFFYFKFLYLRSKLRPFSLHGNTLLTRPWRPLSILITFILIFKLKYIRRLYKINNFCIVSMSLRIEIYEISYYLFTIFER